MQTPICDFVNRYVQRDTLRLHMPGHKGKNLLGLEPYDITEIDGADSLYESSGIIAESEQNAGMIFGANTFYSTEGSSLSIRAMLYLAVLYAQTNGQKPLIAAGRNAHKVFINAAALLNFDILWLKTEGDSYLSCSLTAQDLEMQLDAAKEKPIAVYITCPDYLGNMIDVGEIAKVCHKKGILLLVDNAHGAYLKFLPKSLHPMDLGADLCCDSAHKTLPVLTGGAYLHISKETAECFVQQAQNALALFGSTSPSYLVLQSLDRANQYVWDGYRERLSVFLSKVQRCKERLIAHGYSLIGEEPLKLTVATKLYGYEGTEFARLLQKWNIVCEFADPDFVVLMLTPEIGAEGVAQIEKAFYSIVQKPPIKKNPPQLMKPERVMSVRQAMFSPCETVPSKDSIGRVLAAATVGCPPAVPIVVCGEKIDEAAVSAFAYYGIKFCTVVNV